MGLDLVRLDEVAAAAHRTLGGDSKKRQVLHALQILPWTQENRRPLRKLLQHVLCGNSDYVFDHPATRTWLGRHPALAQRLDVWRNGVPFTEIVSPFGAVTVRVETDPLEALRLGTYVGSCLGLGGDLPYCAAAAILDGNKRVLYARSENGTFLARQLVAYATSGHLVCFEVYPINIPETLKALFTRYDQRLAAALDCPLYQPGGDGYTIELILANGFIEILTLVRCQELRKKTWELLPVFPPFQGWHVGISTWGFAFDRREHIDCSFG